MNKMRTDHSASGGRRPARHAAQTLVAFFLALLMMPALPAPAVEEAPALSLRVTRDALWYTGNEKMPLDVALENPGAQALDGISVTFSLYSSCDDRTELFNFRAAKSHKARETISLATGLKVDPGVLHQEYEVDLPALDLPEGAWPYSVDATRRGTKVAEYQGFLMVHMTLHGEALEVMPLWESHYTPYRDAQGNLVESDLEAACNGEPGSEGFLYSLLSAVEGHPGVKSTLAFSSMVLEDLAELGASSGEQEGGASFVAEALRKSTGEGRASLLSSSYAYADLEQLENRGWVDDARGQVAMGLRVLQDFLPSVPDTGFFPPCYALGPQTPEILAEQGLTYTVVAEEDLAASAEGAALLSGTRAGYPVKLDAGEGQSIDAWVADEQLYAYLADDSTERSDQEVVENLLAETFLMQGDRPAEKRACLLAFPDDFQPEARLMDQIYAALESAPWLQTALPDAALDEVAMPEGPAVLPAAFLEADPVLFGQLDETRTFTMAYRDLLFEENSLKDLLYADVLAAENADLYLEGYQSRGEQVLQSLNDRVSGEMAGVQVQERGTVTLASTKGVLTVAVSNTNDYPIKADLILSDTSVIFPEGNQREVVVNPQDNRFQFDVETQRKGSFLLDIVLTGEGLEISRSTVNLRTSSLNTLALIFLAALLGALLLAMLLRRMSHWGKRGRHEHS